MDKSELEDLIEAHNAECQVQYDMLRVEWEQLRNLAWTSTDPQVLRNLRTACSELQERMRAVQDEKVELKESA